MPPEPHGVSGHDIATCAKMLPEPQEVSGHAFTACEKRHPERHEVSGHDFATCAKMPPELHEVSGHDFSRAEKPIKTWASAPAGPPSADLPRSKPFPQPIQPSRKCRKMVANSSPCHVTTLPAIGPEQRHRPAAYVLHNHTNRRRQISVPNRTHGQPLHRSPALLRASRRVHGSRLRCNAQSRAYPGHHPRRVESLEGDATHQREFFIPRQSRVGISRRNLAARIFRRTRH